MCRKSRYVPPSDMDKVTLHGPGKIDMRTSKTEKKDPKNFEQNTKCVSVYSSRLSTSIYDAAVMRRKFKENIPGQDQSQTDEGTPLEDSGDAMEIDDMMGPSETIDSTEPDVHPSNGVAISQSLPMTSCIPDSLPECVSNPESVYSKPRKLSNRLGQSLRGYLDRRHAPRFKSSKDCTTKVNEIRSYLRNAETQTSLWKARYQLVESQIVALTAENTRQADIIRKLQENALRNLGQAFWMSESNSDIAHKINVQEADAKYWAKRNAIKLEPKSYSRFRTDERIANIVTCCTRANRRGTLANIPEQRISLILQGLLSYRVCTEIYENPFYFLGERLCTFEAEESMDMAERGIAEKFKNLYMELAAINPHGAFKWRAEFLRLLDPPLKANQKMESMIGETKQRTNVSRTESAHDCASRLLSREARFFLSDPHSVSMREELQDILIRSARHSYSLFVQSRKLEIKTLAQLPEKFSHKNPELEAHQIHNKYLNSDQTQFDGKTILIVTHPAIIIYGNEDGTDYTVPHVLKKAVCYMGEVSETEGCRC